MIKRSFQITLGIIVISLGIAGLFLPFLQGILLIILGINILSPYHGQKLLHKIKELWFKICKSCRDRNILK